MNSFTDNSKYLFTYVTSECPEIFAIWISSNASVIATVRAAGGRAYYRWSLPGVYFALRAKFWFVSAYVSDINLYLSRGACLVNLWHGVPLKKIEFDIENGPLARQFQMPTFLERQLFNSHLFRKPEWVISTSSFVTETAFSSAFRVPPSQCLALGYPRLDPFHWSAEKAESWVRRWGTASQSSLIEKIAQFEDVYVYMPTWRDANPNFLEAENLDFAAINDKLAEKKSLLILKLHVATPVRTVRALTGLSNIHVMNPSDDVYPVLAMTTALITDYSSVYLDYLQLNRPICFFIFDFEAYLAGSRGFYFRFEDVSPGIKVRNASGIMQFIGEGRGNDVYKNERARLSEQFFATSDGGASTRIVEFFKSH